MKVVWTRQGWDDYLYWQANNSKIAGSINDLIRDINRSPFQGLGKPEPLKPDLRGWWSRRITGEHRLVYRISGKDETRQIEITSCRYRYK